ncbi:hypothetical protein DFH06DRAFT_1187611 [Mycena polygramma]|nr:hypothetical protein DFH06DRAFT_1187611 [Mycena polygramma]
MDPPTIRSIQPTYWVNDAEYNTIKDKIDGYIGALELEEDADLSGETADALRGLLRGLRPNHWLKHRVYQYVSQFPEANDANTALGEIWASHQDESSRRRRIRYPEAAGGVPSTPVSSPSAPIPTNTGFNRPYPPPQWQSGSASSGESFYHNQGVRNPAGVPPGAFHAPATMSQGYAYNAIPGPPPNSLVTQEGPPRGRRRHPHYGQPSQAQAPVNLQPGYGPGPAYYPGNGQGGYPPHQGPNNPGPYYRQ